MSKLARRIWEIQKLMWDHRNSYVHASNGTVHQQKEEAITAAIQWEFSVYQNGLPTSYSGFFTGQVRRLLKDDSITKSQCLSSVWNA